VQRSWNTGYTSNITMVNIMLLFISILYHGNLNIKLGSQLLCWKHAQLHKTQITHRIVNNSNMTSFFRFVNNRENYPFGINSLAHAPVNVTDFFIGSI